MPLPTDGRWFFGVVCNGCGEFMPIGPDPVDGDPQLNWPKLGSVIANCGTCGRRDVLPATKVTRRRVDTKGPATKS